MNKAARFTIVTFLMFMVVRPCVASAAWVSGGEADSLECSAELFATAFERKVWKNGKDVVVICSSNAIRESREFILKDEYQILTFLNGKKEQIAIEKDAGAKPRKVLFHDETVEITAYLGLSGPALYQQRISCVSNGCHTSEKSCLLAHSENAEKYLSGYDTAISKAGSKSKLSVWQKYFIEGANVKAGETILHEAMLGNNRARTAVLAEVDFDSDTQALRDGLAQDIDSARSVCVSK